MCSLIDGDKIGSGKKMTRAALSLSTLVISVSCRKDVF